MIHPLKILEQVDILVASATNFPVIVDTKNINLLSDITGIALGLITIQRCGKISTSSETDEAKTKFYLRFQQVYRI